MFFFFNERCLALRERRPKADDAQVSIWPRRPADVHTVRLVSSPTPLVPAMQHSVLSRGTVNEGFGTRTRGDVSTKRLFALLISGVLKFVFFVDKSDSCGGQKSPFSPAFVSIR